MFRSPSLLFAGLLAAAALVCSAQPAAAQTPRGYASYGYQPGYYMFPTGINPARAGTQVQQQYRYSPAVVAVTTAGAAALRPLAVPVTQESVVVTVTEPEAAPLLVDLKGPNGEVRSFRVAGGPEAIRVRNFVVHPGESLTLNFQGRPAKVVQ